MHDDQQLLNLQPEAVQDTIYRTDDAAEMLGLILRYFRRLDVVDAEKKRASDHAKSLRGVLMTALAEKTVVAGAEGDVDLVIAVTDPVRELERIERELKEAKKVNRGSLEGAMEAFRAAMECGQSINATDGEKAAQLAMVQKAYQRVEELRSNDTDRVFLLLSERDDQRRALADAFERVKNLELPEISELH